MAKAAYSIFFGPLLSLDVGMLMDKYLGESEKNMRLAIKTAEAAAPCILWIDEIEKAFAGVGGIGGASDVTTRMFGYFLNWLQERKSAVYVIATSNNVCALPPELFRRGRFDDMFRMDLPNDAERIEILVMQLLRRMVISPDATKAYAEYIVKSLVGYESKMAGYNGADIAAVVNTAMEEAYTNQTIVDAQLLLDIISRTKPSIRPGTIEEMNKMYEMYNFVSAS